MTRNNCRRNWPAWIGRRKRESNLANSCPEQGAGFGLGCKLGAACCLCCAAPMLILVALGMMNPFVVIGVAIVIAAEKILPRPETIARFVGLAAMAVGIWTTIDKFNP
ncbi:MAG TPA: DUF2182 domain-containing protein [Verrucomicrobiae bacterium]|nr:DUF2182 domain-containing protein [Verrucomicrobiae bacterium]